METISLRKLVQDRHVQNISTLRVNTNGYPFVTLLGKNSSSTNLYFGKKSAQIITDNAEEGDSIIAMLKNANVVRTENEGGEVRYKLSISEGSNYANVSEMEEFFGVEPSDEGFSVKDFIATFSTVANEVTQP